MVLEGTGRAGQMDKGKMYCFLCTSTAEYLFSFMLPSMDFSIYKIYIQCISLSV